MPRVERTAARPWRIIFLSLSTRDVGVALGLPKDWLDIAHALLGLGGGVSRVGAVAVAVAATGRVVAAPALTPLVLAFHFLRTQTSQFLGVESRTRRSQLGLEPCSL